MKKLSPWIILIACSSFIILHFYNLSHYLINFPTWGDDYLFLAYFSDLPRLEGKEYWIRSTEFHNYIHRIVGARFITQFYHFFSDEFNFKTLTIATNILLLSLLYPLYQLVNKINRLHFIPMVGLLFAWNGNMDNLTLIGVLVHATSMVFLIWIAYLIAQNKTRNIGIWLSLIYPFISSEGLAFIPIIVFFLIYERDRKAWLYAFSGLIMGAVYFWGYVSPPEEVVSSSLISKLLFLVQGTLIFLGGAVKHQVLLATAIGGIFLSNTLFILWRYHKTKDNQLLFAGIVLTQILATGAMITLGRAQDGNFNTLFAERFSFYGSVFICITYYSWIQPNLMPSISFQKTYLILPALAWIGISAYTAYPKLQNLKTRLLADASNAAYFQMNTFYSFGPHESNLLKNSGVYQFPRTLLDTSAKISKELRLEALPSYEAKIREFRVQGQGNILVYSAGRAFCFLPINALSHSVKIKEDVPFNERTSSFALIR